MTLLNAKKSKSYEGQEFSLIALSSIWAIRI